MTYFVYFLIEIEFIVRLDGSTRAATHRINLGIHKPLFCLTLRPGQPQALAIQHDVDACIWLPQISLPNQTDWRLTHEGTINALGYIQASKQQKKFVQCSPDMSYAVICESSRHIFIYLSKHSSASTLKNRNGMKVSIGQQKLFTLDDSDTVLGILVENEITMLLMKNRILCLKINI